MGTPQLRLVLTVLAVVLASAQSAPSEKGNDLDDGNVIAMHEVGFSQREVKQFPPSKFLPEGFGKAIVSLVRQALQPGSQLVNTVPADDDAHLNEPEQEVVAPVHDVVAPGQNPPIGLGAVASSFWDMVTSWVRGVLGVQTRNPPRIARAFIGAAAGVDDCWKVAACKAGRMLRANVDQSTRGLLTMVQPYAPKMVQRALRHMDNFAGASESEQKSCYSYKCSA